MIGSGGDQMRIEERLLAAFARDQVSASHRGATANYDVSNCLDFAKDTIPNFAALIRDKAVLDYGCGYGWQAVAMAMHGARHVCGVDIRQNLLEQGRSLAQKNGVQDKVEFTDCPTGVFDVVVSLSAFEHFSNPEQELARMQHLAKPEGLILISFAEPWYSHSGSHMNDFVRIPWVNLLFSEKAVLKVRQRYRDDGARTYEEVVGGLNRMTVTRFKRIIRNSGMEICDLKLRATKGLPLVTSLPGLQELFTSACCAVLRRNAAGPGAGQPDSINS
jgi:2-polyprenyl-3-methyl-5-hydroxy-6-metoxy-1,4-benzoquinol methylase